jgi:hypothetical protein
MRFNNRYSPHGKSQSFNATTLLPRAMEYEAAYERRNPHGEPQHQKAQFVMFAKEYTNMKCLLQRKQKDSDVLPSHR